MKLHKKVLLHAKYIVCFVIILIDLYICDYLQNLTKIYLISTNQPNKTENRYD